MDSLEEMDKFLEMYSLISKPQVLIQAEISPSRPWPLPTTQFKPHSSLEAAIEENQKAQMAAGSDFTKLQQLTDELAELEAKLEYKTERWMYLTELKEKIDAQRENLIDTGLDPLLTIHNIEAPEKVAVGQEFEIHVTVKNMGTGPAMYPEFRFTEDKERKVLSNFSVVGGDGDDDDGLRVG